ncbi:MAG: hypothetical protein RLZZ383_1867, partial [Pseudomonadota bacterium]
FDAVHRQVVSHRTELLWGSVLAGSLFAAVSLYGYHVADPTWDVDVPAGALVRNPCGRVGARLADGLFQAFGYGAWWVSTGTVVAVLRLAGRPGWTWGRRVVGCVAGALALALIDLGLGVPTHSPFPPGGMVGHALGVSSVALVGPVGAWLVWVPAFVGALGVLLGLSWRDLVVAMIDRVERELPVRSEEDAPVLARVGHVAGSGIVGAGQGLHAATRWTALGLFAGVTRFGEGVQIVLGEAWGVLTSFGGAVLGWFGGAATVTSRGVKRVVTGMVDGIGDRTAHGEGLTASSHVGSAPQQDLVEALIDTPAPSRASQHRAAASIVELAAGIGLDALPPTRQTVEPTQITPTRLADGQTLGDGVARRRAGAPQATTATPAVAPIVEAPSPAVTRPRRGAVVPAPVVARPHTSTGAPAVDFGDARRPARPSGRAGLRTQPGPATGVSVVGATGRPTALRGSGSTASSSTPQPAMLRNAATISGPGGGIHNEGMHGFSKAPIGVAWVEESLPPAVRSAGTPFESEDPTLPGQVTRNAASPSDPGETSVPPAPPPAPPPPRALELADDAPTLGPAVEPGEGLVARVDDDGGAVVDRASLFFQLPQLNLLDPVPEQRATINEEELRGLAQTVEDSLASFKVTGRVVNVRVGPVVTTFEYLPDQGITVKRIQTLSDDLAMALCAMSVRVVAPIPGKGVVGIEVPSSTRMTIYLRELLASDEFRNTRAALPVILGKDVEGRPMVADLARMPHVLVGGTTGSGKSVGVNGMLMSLLFTRTPEELRLLLIDPKKLEFEAYADVPHLLHPVVVDPKTASAALAWACKEMDRRYELLARWAVRNIASYNEKVLTETANWTREKARRYAPKDWPDDVPPPKPELLSYIVIVIDELADLMMVARKDVEGSIVRLAQMARACGMHLVIATQRPSVDVITGIIKANLPTRISFKLRTNTDSRTILDQGGAEKLLGQGDMLYLPGAGEVQRAHGPFVSDAEVERVITFLREQRAPDYIEAITAEPEADGESDVDPADQDELFDEAVEVVKKAGKASTSMIQRHFRIGYNRAARIIDLLEQAGVVGPADGARPREVLIGPHAN